MVTGALRDQDPKRVGSYRLLGRLGAGGMGIVFLGEDSSRRPVAIKVVRSEYADDAGFRSRFRREVRAASKVSGACTAKVLDADVDASQPYLVTEYVPGPTLSSHVEAHGPLRGPQLAAFALALAEALAAVHRAGVVHRDLKPSNVLLGPEGPRVIDFGIARAADATAITQTGTRVGTPAWMAPEQVRGQVVGPLADVFGWGALVAYAGTGRAPFAGDTPESVLYRVMEENPDLGGLDESLQPVVTRTLSKQPSDRPTAVALLRHLLEDETVPDLDTEAGERVTEIIERTWALDTADSYQEYRALRRRGRLVRAALLVALSALLGGGAVWGWSAVVRPQADLEGGPTTAPSSLDPSPSPIQPEPESVDVATLLRDDTVAKRVLYGEIDGTPPEEIVVLSVDALAGDRLPQNYVDVFQWTGDEWGSIFTATEFVPRGADIFGDAPSSDEPIVTPALTPNDVFQDVSFFRLVDFQGDGERELVLGVQIVGAGTGPLSLWILSRGASAWRIEYAYETTRGGSLSMISEDRLQLVTGSYEPSDPLCCPTYTQTDIIGASGSGIVLLDRTVL